MVEVLMPGALENEGINLYKRKVWYVGQNVGKEHPGLHGVNVSGVKPS